MDLRKVSVLLVTTLMMSNAVLAGPMALKLCDSGCYTVTMVCTMVFGSQGATLCGTWYDDCEAFCITGHLLPDELEEPND